MRTLPPVLTAALVLPLVAEAQLSSRSIGLEAGVSRDLAGGAGARGVVALRATAWLEGPAELVARLAYGSAPETSGRETVVSGTAGIRLSAGAGPLRPQGEVELGWAHREREEGSSDLLAWGVGVGLEWFPTLDLSVRLGTALRGRGSAAAAEVAVAAAAYF